MAARILHAVPLLALFLIVSLLRAEAQQPYVDNRQLDCYNRAYDNITEGYTCNGPRSCRSYLTFRAHPPYNTAANIAYLLNASAAEIQSLNRLSSAVDPLPNRELVVIPVNCSCSGGGYYQHNATYKLSDEEETYFSVANDTYQALSTCQAMMSQNPYDSRNLTAGLDLLVPLRCACPTRNQTAAGVKYLLTYLVARGDSVSDIADTFGSTETAVSNANGLASDLIFFFTPLLVPLTTEPSRIQLPRPPPPLAPPPQSPATTPPVEPSGSSRKWVYIGIGIGAALLLVILVSVLLFCFRKRRSQQEKSLQSPTEDNKLSGSSTKHSVPKPQDSKSWSISLNSSETLGLRSAIESLTVYRFHDLQSATSNFSESNKINGSVYRASINGDDAAVKVIKGNVSSSEINLLKKVNHSNIIRLSGFCIHEGNSYLVYEYAENGSVSDWIHSDKKVGTCLTWKQRVTIARDVADALNYLHNYITPPYIHKNLKSSNILLDSNFRAKIANFGLARILNNDGQDNSDLNFQLTRHVVGTQGYLPPEYVENGVITPKLDVFAFGVVVLELLSGKEPATAQKKKKDNVEEEEEEGEMLCTMISRVIEGENVREKLRGFVDPCLGRDYPFELAYSLAQLAKTCVARDLNARPSVAQVLATLSMIVSSSMEWEPSDDLQRSGSLSSSK